MGLRYFAAGLNYIDVYFRTGAYPLPTPFQLGSEGAGTVSAVGEGVDDVAIGDRVAWAMVRGAGYAEQVLLPAERAVPVLEDVVVAAQMGQVARGGRPAVDPGHGVVEVAALGTAPASGEPAGAVPRSQPALEIGRHGVRGAVVVQDSAGDRMCQNPRPGPGAGGDPLGHAHRDRPVPGQLRAARAPSRPAAGRSAGAA